MTTSPITSEDIDDLVSSALGLESDEPNIIETTDGTDKPSEKIKCPICLEKLLNGDSPPTFTPCFHGFHEDCINEYMQRKITERLIPCPMCKEDIADLAGHRDPRTLFEPDRPIQDLFNNSGSNIQMFPIGLRAFIQHIIRPNEINEEPTFEDADNNEMPHLEDVESVMQQNRVSIGIPMEVEHALNTPSQIASMEYLNHRHNMLSLVMSLLNDAAMVHRRNTNDTNSADDLD